MIDKLLEWRRTERHSKESPAGTDMMTGISSEEPDDDLLCLKLRGQSNKSRFVVGEPADDYHYTGLVRVESLAMKLGGQNNWTNARHSGQ